MDLDLVPSLSYFAPEFVLAASALVVWAIDRFAANAQVTGEAALFGAALAVYAGSRLAGWGEGWLFGGLAATDGFATFTALVAAIGAVASIWMLLESRPPVVG